MRSRKWSHYMTTHHFNSQQRIYSCASSTTRRSVASKFIDAIKMIKIKEKKIQSDGSMCVRSAHLSLWNKSENISDKVVTHSSWKTIETRPSNNLIELIIDEWQFHRMWGCDRSVYQNDETLQWNSKKRNELEWNQWKIRAKIYFIFSKADLVCTDSEPEETRYESKKMAIFFYLSLLVYLLLLLLIDKTCVVHKYWSKKNNNFKPQISRENTSFSVQQIFRSFSLLSVRKINEMKWNVKLYLF